MEESQTNTQSDLMCHGFAVCSRGLRLQGIEALLPLKASEAQHVDDMHCGMQTMLAHLQCTWLLFHFFAMKSNQVDVACMRHVHGMQQQTHLAAGNSGKPFLLIAAYFYLHMPHLHQIW